MSPLTFYSKPRFSYFRIGIAQKTLFIALIASIFTYSCLTSFATQKATPVLKFSKSSDRENKQLLSGAIVKGTIYIVLTGPNIDSVSFSLDNDMFRKPDENRPFDFSGSKNGRAIGLNTKLLVDGSHRVTAKIKGKSNTTVTSIFTVKNNLTQTSTTVTTIRPGTTQPATTTTPTTTPVEQTTTPPTTLPPVNVNQIAGVTIDNPWKIDQVISSLDQLKISSGKEIMARIVFDAASDGVTAKDYAEILPSIHSKHKVMGELIDSFYVKNMSVDQYRARANEYYSTLKSDVDIWEIGNEVNGEWVGDPSATAQKIDAAYSVIGEKSPTALTLHCDREKDDMYAFSNRITPSTRAGIDYIFVSQYDADCIYTSSKYAPEQTDAKGRLTAQQWANRFAKLASFYPNAKVGFGEVGIAEQLRSSSSDTVEAEVISHYYSLGLQIIPLLHSINPDIVYVGGYFYWYYSKDMVPFNKNPTLTAQLVSSIKNL